MKRKVGILSLERFAKAKQTGFDKRAKVKKELALKAKQVNKYRKLRQKLAGQGVLASRINYTAQVRKVRSSTLNLLTATFCPALMPLRLLLYRRRKEIPLMTGQHSPDVKRLNWKESNPGESTFVLSIYISYITDL